MQRVMMTSGDVILVSAYGRGIIVMATHTVVMEAMNHLDVVSRTMQWSVKADELYSHKMKLTPQTGLHVF